MHVCVDFIVCFEMFLLLWLLMCAASLLGCETYIEQSSQDSSIAEPLLRAISLVESGRFVNRKRVAWPWTVQAEGVGRMFTSKQAAIEAVQELQNKGVESIDVGCMQINLKHHPHAFQSLSDAFDPQKNVAYAARFLKGLYNKWQSWKKAVAYYHSAYAAGLAYQKRVYQALLSPESPMMPHLIDEPCSMKDTRPYVRVTKRIISLVSGIPPIEVVTTKRFMPLSCG